MRRYVRRIVQVSRPFAAEFLRQRKRMIATSQENRASPTLTGGQRWFVAFTRPRKELIAIENLERQGWRTFLPFLVVTRRHARQFRTVRTPAFPRYVFLALDLDRDRWRSVNGTRGVERLFMADERPIPVPEGIVETMIQSIDSNGALNFESSLTPGSPVRLVSGPFAEALGVLRTLNASGRVEVLVNFLGSSICLKADVAQIVPAMR